MRVQSLDNDTQAAAKLAGELRSTFSRLKRRLREQSGRGDLPPSQVAVVLRLEQDGPMTASGLARAEAMRPQSMSTILAQLFELGYVSGSADPKDGRQTLISLTPTCRKLIESGRAARQDWLTRTIEERLSPADQKRLAAALGLLRKLADE